ALVSPNALTSGCILIVYKPGKFRLKPDESGPINLIEGAWIKLKNVAKDLRGNQRGQTTGVSSHAASPPIRKPVLHQLPVHHTTRSQGDDLRVSTLWRGEVSGSGGETGVAADCA